MGSPGDQEVAQLDKVLTRLALTEAGGLEKVSEDTTACLVLFRSTGLRPEALERAQYKGQSHLMPFFPLAQVLSKLLPVVIGELKSSNVLTRKKVSVPAWRVQQSLDSRDVMPSVRRVGMEIVLREKILSVFESHANRLRQRCTWCLGAH